MPDTMALVTTKLAASGAPCSLRNVPLTSTSTFGTVYVARPVTRVVKPVDVWQYGNTGLAYTFPGPLALAGVM